MQNRLHKIETPAPAAHVADELLHGMDTCQAGGTLV